MGEAFQALFLRGGVVDQDVDLAQLIDGLVDPFLANSLVHQISRQQDVFHSGLLDVLGGHFCILMLFPAQLIRFASRRTGATGADNVETAAMSGSQFASPISNSMIIRVEAYALQARDSLPMEV